MRYSDEAVIVHNQGLGRALLRLVVLAIVIGQIGEAMLDVADGRLGTAVARVVGAGLVATILRR